MNTKTPEAIEGLYKDAEACAKAIGLTYDSELPGFTRKRTGKGFTVVDASGAVVDKQTRQRIDGLVIPPAWQDVWICTRPDGHILATGIDSNGRKQYIYHPKWRTARDLLKFYRLITFGHALPGIRKAVTSQIDDPSDERQQLLAAMIWILDNTYLRVGNEIYFTKNESVGLTTLTDKHVLIDGPLVTFGFKGKSGKDHNITFENHKIAEVIAKARGTPGPRLFEYTDTSGKHGISAAEINRQLSTISGKHISAKDFRTWGGTLMAFNHLIENHDTELKEAKVVVQAVDAAANILGNTRAIAKASYIHPDILELYGQKDFEKYYQRASSLRKIPLLDRRESELLRFLEMLFEREFRLLKEKVRS